MTATPAFELHAGALRLALRPDLGGSIAGLWHRDQPVLRSTEPAQLESARKSGCFPLLPYSNRLGFRQFRWKGQSYTTRPNFEGSAHSLHGVGWMRPWEIESSSTVDVVLGCRHDGDADWPFAYEARQYFNLSPSTLERADGVHEPGRGRAAGRARLASVLPSAPAQPPAHRAVRSLGFRRHAAADPQGRAARHRQRRRPPRLRQLLRRLARPGAHPRREVLAAADLVARLPRRLHAAGARLLLRRAGQPRQQRDPHGRAGQRTACAASRRASRWTRR